MDFRCIFQVLNERLEMYFPDVKNAFCMDVENKYLPDVEDTYFS